MKPFELTVYPIVDRIPDGPGIVTRIYGTEHGGIYDWQAERMAKEKRLTNAELAAEYESARCDALLVQATGHYWQSIECTWSQDTERVNERERTLIRFETLPHYDEVPE